MPRRVLIYSHDTYGLGHLRRNMLIAARLARLPSRPRVLIATGSPRAQAFRPPQGCDTLKLPAVLKQTDGRYGTRSLGISLPDVTRLRADLLVCALRSFRPDLVLVDHAPIGMGGELVPLLEAAGRRRRRPRLVLGLRDVIDDAGDVRRHWTEQGIWPHIRGTYDDIFVYGDPRVLTTAHELGLADDPRTRFTHYLGRPMPPRSVALETPSLLVTTGGGGDGQAVLRAFVEYLEPRHRMGRSLACQVVTGPFLSKRRFASFTRALAALDPEVQVHEFVEDLEYRMAAAAAVVTMGGYNSVVEILTSGVPALIVPRSRPRREQLIRAERLAAVTDVELCPAEHVNGEVLAEFVERASARPRASAAAPGVRLDGLDRIAALLEERLDLARRAHTVRETDDVRV